MAAWNWVGVSAYSEANEGGELARTVPLPPLPPTEGALTTENELQVDWVAVTGSDTGNSEVLTYSLWWDNGDGGDPTVELLEDLVFTEYITGLLPGSYRFMVRANNIYGYGEWSEVAEIRASYVPDVLATMTVKLNYPYFDFAWAEPLTGSEAVDAYEILIYSPATLTYYEDKAYCDGDDDGAQETGRLCQVYVDVLLADYGYDYNQLPLVKGRAHNTNGFGGFSSPNTQSEVDAYEDYDGTVRHLIEGVPTFAPQPREGAGTDAGQIEVEWDAVVLTREPPSQVANVVETGNSEITSYVIQWDEGSGETTWTTLAGVASEFTGQSYTFTAGVTQGVTYAFRTALQNRHGQSALFGVDVYSEVGYITPSQVPD